MSATKEDKHDGERRSPGRQTCPDATILDRMHRLRLSGQHPTSAPENPKKRAASHGT